MKKRPARASPRTHTFPYRVARRVAKVLWYGSAAIVALLAVALVAARLLLPTVADKKDEIEALLARESGYTVRIEQVEGYWDNLYPGLRMRGIAVSDAAGQRPAVRLAELRFSLKIFPLFVGRIDIHSAVLVQPIFSLERLEDGRFQVSGISASEQADSAQNEMFLAWLFRQRRLVIQEGELQWFDRRVPGQRLRLTHVNLQLRNSGDRHRLGASAELPAGMCNDCSLAADITGNPFLSEGFQGDLYVRARDVDVERLPLALREHLPQQLRGKYSVELWSAWKDSRPVSVNGELAVADLRLPLRDLRVPLSVKQAATKLHWEGSADEFEMRLDNLRLALHGAPWSAGKLQFTRKSDATMLSIERVELADITAFVGALRMDPAPGELPYEKLAPLWSGLAPAGTIKNLRMEVNGALDAPQDYTLSADVEALAITAYKEWPGVRGVSGSLRLTHDEGTLKLDMRDGALALPAVFRAPLPIARAQSELRWRYEVDQWVITAESLSLENEDIKASGRLLVRLPDDAARSPYLALNLEFHDGNGANAARYYPARHLLPATLAWMEYSFAGGNILRGSLVYDGHTRDFPFDSAPGRFQIRAKVRNGIYRYLTGWEPATAVVADVSVDGDRFIVSGRGRIGTLTAREIVVKNPTRDTVEVYTNILGATAESVRVLREVKGAPGENEWQMWVAPALQAAGNGVLSLIVKVPVEPGTSRVHGEYRFIDGNLRLADTAVEAKHVAGTIGFSEDGVREGRVRAQFLGDQLALAIDSPRPAETVAVLHGRATAGALAPLLGPTLAPRFGGAIPWEAQLRFLNGRTEVSAEADLSAMTLSLPAPLHRPDGFGAEKLRVRTEAATRNELTLGVDVGRLAQGRLRIERRDGWKLAGGRLIFNETPTRAPEPVSLPTERGLHLLLRLDDFDLDRWRSVFGDGGTGEMPAWLARVSANIRRLTFLEREFGSMNLDLAQTKGTWAGSVSGTGADGRVRIETTPATRIGLDLAHLRVPPAKSKDSASATNPAKLPHLTLKTKALYFDERMLGELDFAASPVYQGWRVERALLTRLESRLEASGHWRMDNTGRPISSFNARVVSEDIGRAATALGFPDQIDRGEVDLNAQLSWNGAPADVDFPSLKGNVELTATKGRFPQVRQGAGRLFGVLDFTAITRYLSLDFSPIFGKGFAFDLMQGHLVLDRGNAYTEDFSIDGPSARLRLGGRVGVAVEDFDLTMDIYPSISDSLTLGSLVAGGPQVALWAFLVQKIFKKQIEEGTRVTYFIKGSWDNPEVTRKLVEPPKTESGAGF